MLAAFGRCAAPYFASGEQWLNHTDDQFLFRQATTFADKTFDPLTGYYYFGARYYEPRLGIWESTDPALSDYMGSKQSKGVFQPKNLASYTYGWSNPVMLQDLNGRQALTKEQIAQVKQGAALVQIVNLSHCSGAQGDSPRFGRVHLVQSQKGLHLRGPNQDAP